MAKVLIGHIEVDAGKVWIGDPCDIVPTDGAVYQRLAAGTEREDELWERFLATATGVYPVYAEIAETGHIISVTVEVDKA